MAVKLAKINSIDDFSCLSRPAKRAVGKEGGVRGGPGQTASWGPQLLLEGSTNQAQSGDHQDI